jgi:glycosyltransferase involved in cell wall biosynthesis
MSSTASSLGRADRVSTRARDRRVRVLMLGLIGDDPATTRYYGGVARTLDQSRYSLLFGTVRSGGRVQERVASYGHRTFSLGCRSTRDYPVAILRLARIIRNEKIDIVHGNEELPSFLSGIAGIVARRGVRIYHRQHDVSASYALDGRKAGALVKRLAAWVRSANYSNVDRTAGATAHVVFTLSEAHRANVLRERPHWARKAIVVPHGIDEPTDWPRCRERAEKIRGELGLAADDPAVTIVARLNWRKGHEVLFDAAARLGRRGRAPAVLVVGYGPLEDELRARAAAFGLSRTFFLGKHEDVWPYYLAGWVAAVPSVTEPFGLVSIEAMACGRPVLASAVGGLTEIVVDGSTGRLVPPSDPDALAAALGEMLADQHSRTTMGAEGRRRYLEHFSQDAMTRRWEEVYQTLVLDRRPP